MAASDTSGMPVTLQASKPAAAARVHLVQMDIIWEQPEANHARAAALVDKARDQDKLSPGDLILLPEMFATGFSFSIQTTADANGSTLRFLSDLATRTGCYVQGGRTVTAPGQATGAAATPAMARNVMSVLGPQSSPGQPGAVLCEYTKMHPFQGERERFEAGTQAAVWEWKAAGLRVAPAICYDLRFPEVFGEGLRRGAEMFAIGACWPSVRLQHWRALSIARAIENQAYVAAVNRVGDDPGSPQAGGLHYGGCSMVVSPMGEVLAEEWEKECVLSVEIDAAAVREWRGKFGAWRERGGG